jgi:hypothetical protein
MKRLAALLFSLLFFSAQSGAQQVVPRFAVYFSNPISLLSKARIKFEYRVNRQHAIQFSATNYHGFCPGFQTGFEYRNYRVPGSAVRSENFLYAKAGMGNSDVSDYEYRTNRIALGYYNYVGGGVGRHFTLGRERHFFLDLAGGLKLILASRSAGDINNGFIFYTTGPGSVIDLNLHFGWQF